MTATLLPVDPGGNPGLVRALPVPRDTTADFDKTWSALVDGTGSATFFAGPVFQNALRKAFGDKASVSSVAAFRDGTLAGWLPLFRLPGMAGLRETGFARNAHTLRNHLLTEDREVITAMLEVWRDHVDADTLLLENLPLSDVLANGIRDAARRTSLTSDPPTRGRTLDFAATQMPYDDYLATRSGQFRRQLRKRLRDLENAGRFRINRLSGDDLQNAMPDWQAVVAQSWQGRDLQALSANTPTDWVLHAALARNGALWIARLDDRPVAALRMLEDARAAYVHTMHFDQGLRDFAPGLVLFDAMMRDACERGLPRVDFNGTSEFFARWATGETAHMSIRIYRDSLRGRGARLARSALRRLKSRPTVSLSADAAPETLPERPAQRSPYAGLTAR